MSGSHSRRSACSSWSATGPPRTSAGRGCGRSRVIVGLLFVISATTRRVMAQREVAEVGSDSVDAEIVGPDEDEG